MCAAGARVRVRSLRRDSNERQMPLLSFFSRSYNELWAETVARACYGAWENNIGKRVY